MTLIFAFTGTARQLTKHLNDAELFPELHPPKPMAQWELDGSEQAIAYARKHRRKTLYQAYTNDLAD